MVEVSVCTEQVLWRQLLVGNILFYRRILIGITGAAVDNDALARFVAYHKAVFLQGVDHKSFDVQHFSEFVVMDDDGRVGVSQFFQRGK